MMIFIEYEDDEKIEEMKARVDTVVRHPPAWMTKNVQEAVLPSIVATTGFHYNYYKRDYARAEKYLHMLIARMEQLQAQWKTPPPYGKQVVPENIDWAGSLQAVLADLQLKQGKIRQAEKTFKMYEQRMTAWQGASAISRHAWTMKKLKADISRANGDLDGAVAHYTAAEVKLESTRRLLKGTRFKILFTSAQTELYDSLVSILTELGSHERAFEYSERSRARAFLDMMGDRDIAVRDKETAELMRERRRILDTLEQQIGAQSGASGQSAGSASRGLSKTLDELESAERTLAARYPDLASTITVRVETLSKLQKALEPGTVAVEYYLTEEELYYWAIDRDHVHGGRVENFGKARIARLVQQLRGRLTSGRSSGHQRPIEELHRLLIHPVADAIAEADRVCFVPHGVLHYLPFGLLGQGDRCLLDDHAVLYAPSVNVYALCRQKAASKRFSILALGNPDLGDEDLSLPFAQKEVEGIQQMFPDAMVFIGAEATEGRFMDLASDRSIVHLAAHGLYNLPDPLRSGIQLAGKDEESRALTAEEVYNTALDAYAAVLSACETALGKRTDGDEIIGLTRAFMYAGSPLVLSTLWSVNDEATAFLMAAFYENLRHMDKAEALRQAQLRTRGRYPHPFYWGAFVLNGD